MNFYDRQKHIFAGGTQFVLRFFSVIDVPKREKHDDKSWEMLKTIEKNFYEVSLC